MEIISYSQHVDHQEAAANEKNKTNDDLYKLRALIGHQGSPKVPATNLKRCNYNVLVEWETGVKTYEPLSVLPADDTITCASYTKGNGISYLDGWKRFKNLATQDKPDLFSIASPKGEMKSTFSWTSLSKIPTSSTLCFGEPTLEKLNQVKLLCSSTSSTLCDPILAKLTSCPVKLSYVSPWIFLFVILLFILELPSLCHDLLRKQTKFPTEAPA